MTVVPPRVSTSDSDLTTALDSARRCAPDDSIVCTNVGRPTGIAAIAVETHSSTSVVRSWPRTMPKMAITATASQATVPNTLVMPSSSRCSGERDRFVAVTMSAIWPISVAAPVAVTTNAAEPRVTCVFWNTRFVRSPSGTSPSGSASRSLDTGALSPVSAASCTSSVAEEMILPSAGTTSPASTSTTSPGTSLVDSTSSTWPDRRTRARGTWSSASAATLARALSSWFEPMTTLNVTSASTTIAVGICPMAMLAAPTISSMMFIGLVSCPRATTQTLGGGSVGSSLGPYWACRWVTAPASRPWPGSTSSALAASSAESAYQATSSAGGLVVVIFAGSRSGRPGAVRHLPPDNVGARGPRHDRVDVVECADGRAHSGVRRKAAGGLDLRAHGPGRELVTRQFLGRHLIQPPLLRLAPVEVDAVHIGCHQEQVRGHVLGEQFAREILVDDRFDAYQTAMTGRPGSGGNAAAARADDHGVPVKQPGDRLDLHDAFGLGRGHHPPPLGTVLPERPALPGGQFVGGLLVIDRADELGGAGERRVLRVHHDHGQQRRHLVLWRQEASQFLLDQVADHPLGTRVQDIQRVRLGAVVGLGLQRQQANLRAVAVDDHNAVLCGKGRDRLCRYFDVLPLNLGGHRVRAPQQCITPQRYDYSHPQPLGSVNRWASSAAGWPCGFRRRRRLPVRRRCR